jgi:hypothetical protein
MTRRGFHPADDYYQSVRQVILGKEVGNLANAALVMTTLSVGPLCVTSTQRPIVTIPLSSKLNEAAIVDEIFLPRILNPEKLRNEERKILMILSVLVNRAPRLVQLMAESIDEIFQTKSKESLEVNFKNAEIIDELLSIFKTKTKLRYPDVSFPKGLYLHALLTGTPITVDSQFLAFVRFSTFTNSIQDLSFVSSKLVPEALPYLLLSNVDCILSFNYDEEVIYDLMRSVLDATKKTLSDPDANRGWLLKQVFENVFYARIISMRLKVKEPGVTCLKDVLGLNLSNDVFECLPQNLPIVTFNRKNASNQLSRSDGENVDINNWFNTVFKYHMYMSNSSPLLAILCQPFTIDGTYDNVPGLIESGNRNVSLWKKDIKALAGGFYFKLPNEEGPEKESCDAYLFVELPDPSTGTLKKYVLFIDLKSLVETETDPQKRFFLGHFHETTHDKTILPYSQYGEMRKRVNSIVDADLEGDNGYLTALKEGRYLFVYITTHEGRSVYVTPNNLAAIYPLSLQHNESKSLGVIVLNRAVTQKILGPSFESYILPRSVS